MQTVVHVTHEAIHKIGGIGAVLHGLLTSPVYLEQAKRNILVGPFWPTDASGETRLGADGEVLYSSLDSLYRSPLAARFREIEQTYGVGIVYGRRKFVEKGTGVVSTPEVLLIDVANYDKRRLGEFKFALWDKFGLDSAKYEFIWDYEQYVRLAQPAIAALHALGATTSVEPCVSCPTSTWASRPRWRRSSSRTRPTSARSSTPTRPRPCAASSRATRATTRCSTT